MLYKSIAKVPDINREKFIGTSKTQTGNRICETHRGTWCRSLKYIKERTSDA